jgi:type II secretory pathway pseudopilin PulG
MKRAAFTMLELIFVIVIMGIIGKFGVEFLMQAYNGFIFSAAQNRLQSQSEAAVTLIATRLQYRIKDSIIARMNDGTNSFRALANANGSERILEWVGYDIDGWRGRWNGSKNQPTWSGFIDVDAIDDTKSLYTSDATTTRLVTPGSDLSMADNIILDLSYANADINSSAIKFIGGNSNILTGYGWDGTATDQNGTMLPISSDTSNGFRPLIGTGNWDLVDIYEYYQLAWTAYAIVHSEVTINGKPSGILTLWYDYQPWLGERYTDGTSAILAEHVDTFRFRSIGDVIKIQVCTTDEDIFKDGEYSVCKEKTIF